jgi:hypothetical protein
MPEDAFKTEDEDKQSKKHNTAQKSKAMSNPTRTHPRYQG